MPAVPRGTAPTKKRISWRRGPRRGLPRGAGGNATAWAGAQPSHDWGKSSPRSRPHRGRSTRAWLW
eukprot:2489796-Alexandrium_andersonii.AAC.1